MKIGFYIHHTSLKAGGIFTYSIGILKLLLQSDEIQKILLIISRDQQEYFHKIINNPKVEFNIVDRSNFFVNILFTVSYVLSNAAAYYKSKMKKPRRLKFLAKLSALLNPYTKHLSSSKIDILHVPFQYSPIYSAGIPIITTMHDIQEYHFPKNFTAIQKLHRQINNAGAIYESDHIIVSFDHVKNDLLKYFNINESKISVCPPPFTQNWFLSKGYTKTEDLKSKYQVENEFILYPAATWKHKNHTSLFNAISRLGSDNLNIQLICTGNKTDYFDILKKEIEQLQLNEAVKFLGIVPEEDLIGLYKSASLVVIPTKYEAGSGPLYEAMKYSVPVICSNVTSLPETMGNDKFTFDPDNFEEIAQVIKIMLTEKEFRRENIKNSEKRLKELAKNDYAMNFIQVYKKLLNN